MKHDIKSFIFESSKIIATQRGINDVLRDNQIGMIPWSGETGVFRNDLSQYHGC